MGNGTITDSANHSSARAWIEDGILYNKYTGEVTLEKLLDVEKQSVDLIRQNKINLVPAIIDFTDADDNIVNLHFSDYGKVVSAYKEQINLESGIWIVGTGSNTGKFAKIVSDMFFN